jgi:hypothetical protein
MTQLIIDGFIAFGTIAVAVLAIWGDWLRSILAPLKLTLTLHTPEGDPTLYASGGRAMFFHLKVINQRPWLPARNCRVMLVGLSRRDPSGIFQPVRMSFPSQFTWTPLEFTLPVITLLKEHIFDFGYIEEKGNRFIPRLYATPVNFQGFVGQNEAVRFQIQIEAINFLPAVYVIEVAWDGIWSFVPDEMRRHLPIRLVPSSAM